MDTINLQEIYDDAINKKHPVFFEWFPKYEQVIKEYKEQAINNRWEDNIFQRLIKNVIDDGIANLRQGNFTWEEYENIKNNWNEIQATIKDIAEKNNITPQIYKKIVSFFQKQTKGNRPAAINRVIASFLPNIVTTAVTGDYLNFVIEELKKLLPDYPSRTKDWLQDNVNFIND